MFLPPRPAIALGGVMHVGYPVAVVVADMLDTARDAANASSSNMRRVLLFYRHATLSSQTLRSSMTIARTTGPISMRLAIKGAANST